MIGFTFDDYNTSDIWAATMLASFGLKGIFFLNEHPGLDVTVEALLRLNQIVGNHTRNHTRLAGASDAQIADAILPFNERLRRLGASGEYFSFPWSDGPRRHPLLTTTFRYLYRGYTEPHADVDGEISRVTVSHKPFATVLGYRVPLQMHAIGPGQDIDMEQFIQLCERWAQIG